MPGRAAPRRSVEVDPSRLHRLFYPQVPAVLSAGSGGRVSAMAVVSYAAVSDEPPLVAVACDPRSYTLELALLSRAFSLCLLAADKAGAVGRLGSESGRGVADKLAMCGLHSQRGRALDLPVVAEAEATIECRIESKRRLGDHLLVVGRVEACYASGGFGEFWDFRKYRPILYTGWKGGLTTYGTG